MISDILRSLANQADDLDARNTMLVEENQSLRAEVSKLEDSLIFVKARNRELREALNRLTENEG